MATNYKLAKQIYADFGVDTEKAMEILDQIPLSMHCWQGDDVGGFETPDATLGCGGIQTTGNFPGKARNPDELRADIDEARKYIPGKTRINLHAIYGEFGGKKVDRNEVSYDNFKGWTDWCKSRKMGIDFNPTFFSHPLAADGFTLSSADKSVRKFWIEHGIACRKIAEKIGKELSDTVITNFWMPDGMKDFPADRLAPRERMANSLDEIFSAKISKKYNRDSVECKLFGNRQRKLCRRLARILHGLRGQEPAAAHARLWALPPHRNNRRQDFLHVDVRPRTDAARLARSPLGQRPRRSLRRPDNRGNARSRPLRTTRQSAYRNGLLRREHQ